MHIHVCRPIFDFNFNKVIIFLNLNAHKIYNYIIFSYFKIMQILGCYIPTSESCPAADAGWDMSLGSEQR